MSSSPTAAVTKTTLPVNKIKLGGCAKPKEIHGTNTRLDLIEPDRRVGRIRRRGGWRRRDRVTSILA
jgi:hypothetical protein